ncbi:hypothetical protein ABPG72_013927 [Tetrahymena utriculariae]
MSINQSQCMQNQNQTLDFDYQNTQILNDMSIDASEIKSILPSHTEAIDKKTKHYLQKDSMKQKQILESMLEESELTEISLAATVDTLLGIEKIIQVVGLQASYACLAGCLITNFDEKSKLIECNCSKIKLYMKDKFVPIIKEKTTKKLDELTFNDLSIFFQFQAQTHGVVKFQYLKLLIKCKKCAETSIQTLDLNVILTAHLKPEIKYFNFNFQAMCNKCCSIQYLNINNLKVNYAKIQ